MSCAVQKRKLWSLPRIRVARSWPTKPARISRQLQDVAGLDVETRFTYYALDNLTTVTDPKGLTTRYTHDGLGNVLSLASPDTGTTALRPPALSSGTVWSPALL